MNVNPTNNTGNVYIDATYHEFVITPGVYSTFVTLATAIQTALNEAAATIAKIASFAVAHNPVSRKFVIGVTMAAGQTAEVQIRCFLIKSGAMPAGVSLQGGFNDLQ